MDAAVRRAAGETATRALLHASRTGAANVAFAKGVGAAIGQIGNVVFDLAANCVNVWRENKDATFDDYIPAIGKGLATGGAQAIVAGVILIAFPGAGLAAFAAGLGTNLGMKRIIRHSG